MVYFVIIPRPMVVPMASHQRGFSLFSNRITK